MFLRNSLPRVSVPAAKRPVVSIPNLSEDKDDEEEEEDDGNNDFDDNDDGSRLPCVSKHVLGLSRNYHLDHNNPSG